MERIVSWVEIPTKDIEKSLKYYNNVFKLSLEAIDCGEEKMACFPSGDGAISQARGFEPSNKGTLASFTVPDSIEATLARVQENGGRIVNGKTKIEADNAGYFALVEDLEGNVIGLHEK